MLAIEIIFCHAQDLTKDTKCNSKIEIQYDKITKSDKRSNVIESSKSKSFVVKFMNEFSDSIQVYINNKLEFNDFVSTDRVSSETDKVFGYDYSKASEKICFKFISLTRHSCSIVNLNKKYKIVYVFIDRTGKWTVRFSNVHYIH